MLMGTSYDLVAISIHAPLSGVRPAARAVITTYLEISIHAPLSGVRLQYYTYQRSVSHFNPRTPERGATIPALPVFTIEKISIHAPLSGVRRGSQRC